MVTVTTESQISSTIADCVTVTVSLSNLSELDVNNNGHELSDVIIQFKLLLHNCAASKIIYISLKCFRFIMHVKHSHEIENCL